MQKNLFIAYFSRPGENYAGGSIVSLPVGNTEIAAKKAQALTGGDLFRILPAHPYPESYYACTEAAQRELREGARPEIAEAPARLDRYGAVLLAYPNWWGSMPMPVWTFLEQNDFSGKQILPLCTHEGSGMGRSEADIQKLCPNSDVRSGLPLLGSRVASCDALLSDWLKKTL